MKQLILPAIFILYTIFILITEGLDQYEEEIPEPDSDELPEDPGEETIEPAEQVPL